VINWITMMIHRDHANIILLDSAAQALGDLTNELVFVGGCAVCALITDPAAPMVRPTVDVDVVTEAATIDEYYSVADRFRAAGFKVDRSPSPLICRWHRDSLIVDLMPVDEEVLGFGNPWYRRAVSDAELFTLPSEKQIYLVSAPAFLATKLEAFRGRGNRDFVGSHDIEDIIAVIDGRAEINEEINDADGEIREYLAFEFSKLMGTASFGNSLPGHVPGDAGRVQVILRRMSDIVASG